MPRTSRATLRHWRALASVLCSSCTSRSHFVIRARIVEALSKRRLPAMFGSREVVEAGGLISYAASVAEVFRRSAVYVDKILKGAKPADLPVEQPTKFELVINSASRKG